MQDFKHILAWQRAHALAIALQKRARGFSRAGHGTLRSHLTNAAETVASSIVDGCGASTKREFGRLLDVAIRSANQTENHLLSARGLDLLSADDCQKYTAEVIEIRKMIYGYRKRINQTNPEAARQPKRR